MSVTGSVYYSYLKNIGACQEGLDYVATQSCQEASDRCCPTPEFGKIWFDSMPQMTGYFTNIEKNYISDKLTEIARDAGQEAANRWVYNHFGQIYIDDINKKTLVTENLISHTDVSIPWSYQENNSVIYDLSGNLSDGVLYGSLNYTPGYISHLSLTNQDSFIDFGKKFWFDSDNSTLGKNFTLRIVCRFFSFPETSSGRITLFSRFDNSNGYRLEVSSGKLIWLSTNLLSQEIEVESDNIINEFGKWYDICLTVSSGAITLHRNGQSVSDSLSIGLSKATDDPFRIGKLNDQSFDFDFMHFSAYNRGLTPEEVLRNYKAIKGRFQQNI